MVTLRSSIKLLLAWCAPLYVWHTVDSAEPGVSNELAPCPELPPLKGAASSYAGLKVRLKEVPYKWQSGALEVSGNYYYPSFLAGAPTVKEFVDLLYWSIVPYCLPRKVREQKQALYEQTQDMRYMSELIDQAKGLFAKARSTIAKAGEPGEVALFVLTEAVLGAPQIACKMYLKTNSEMPVHGSDGVHISFDKEGQLLRLFWGESKLYAKLSDALDAIVNLLSLL